MITANFNAYNSYVTDSVYQWDINHDLVISGLNLSAAPEIHFTNANMDRAIPRQSALNDGIITVQIPNSLLQEALTVKAYVGVYEGGTFKVIELIEIPVIAKARPSDYRIEDSDEEIYSFNKLENEIVNAKRYLENLYVLHHKTLRDEVEKAKDDLERSVNETTDNLNARFDNLVANENNTEGNSELIDIRVDVDGRTHENAGAAVRYQIKHVNVRPQNTSFFVWKNLLNQASMIQGYYVNQATGLIQAGTNHSASEYIPVKPNTPYVCSPTNGAFRYAIYDSTHRFISGNVGVMGFTTPANAAFIRVSWEKAEEKQLQVEEGTEATEYVPYGTTYIKPEYIRLENKDIIEPKDTSFFVEKNLLNEEAMTVGYAVNQATGAIFAAEAYRVSDYIAVKPNTSYACSPSSSAVGSPSLRYAIYDKNKTFVTGGYDVYVFTTPENAAFIRVSYNKTFIQLQVEEGELHTDYVPYGTFYLDPKYVRPNADAFLLNLPDKIYALVGEELNIYFDNLVDGHDTDYVWDVVCSVGEHMERGYRLIPTAAGNQNILISATNRNGVTVTKSAKIYIANTAANAGATKSVLILGDSTTANGVAVTKLKENFTGDVMGLTTLGTLGTAPNNHEGRSGWKFATYFESRGENAFYNPNTNTFDAQYYFDNSGVSIPDYFIVNLGINDTFGETNDENLLSVIDTINGRCDHIIQSVRSACPNAKICIALTIPPNYSQDAFAKDYTSNQNRARYKRNNVIWVDNLIRRYGQRETEGIYLIPIHTNLDTKYNMGTVPVQVNKRNSTTYEAPIGNSGVHPAESGYWQIADAYWFFLKNQT